MQNQPNQTKSEYLEEYQKTIQLNTENLTRVKETELKIIECTKRYLFSSDENIKMLSDAIKMLLCDDTQATLQNNCFKALELARTISFTCEQKMNFEYLEFFKNKGL